MENNLISRLESRIKALQSSCEQLQRENQSLRTQHIILVEKNHQAILTIEKIIQQIQLLERQP